MPVVARTLYGLSSLLASTACLLYLPLRRHLQAGTEGTHRATHYDLLWALTFFGALASYVLRPEPYERPPVFFVLISLSIGILSAKILMAKEPRAVTTLAQVAATGLTLVWTVMLMFPTVVGMDSWTHRELTQRIVSEGVAGFKWHGFPIMHYLVASWMKVTGLPYHRAIMLVPFLQTVGNTALLFLIGRRIASVRAGLLAALIVSFSGWLIFFGYWVIPNAIAVTMLLLAVYLIIRYQEGGSAWLIPAILVTAGVLTLTHILATAWLLVMLVLLGASMLVSRTRIGKVLPALAVAMFGGAIAVWIASGFWENMMQFIHYRFNPETIGLTLLPGSMPNPSSIIGSCPPVGIALPPSTSGLYTDTLASASITALYNAAGMVLGFLLAAWGGLYLLAKRNRNHLPLFLVAAFIFVLAGGTIPSLFGASLIEHRWWYVGQAFGALLIAPLIVALRPATLRIGAAVLVAALSFLMITGLPANTDNTAFLSSQTVRYALTEEEIGAVLFIADNYEGTIGVDAYYTLVGHVLPEHRSRLLNISTSYLSGNYDEAGDVVLVRDAIAYRPFAFGEGNIFVLNYDPNRKLIEEGYTPIYDAGGVKGYTRLVDSAWLSGPPLPAARYSVTVNELAHHDGKIYIIGGFGASGRVQTTIIYDVATSTYSYGTDYPETGIAGHAQVYYDGEIYLFGGVKQDTAWYTHDVQIYNIANDSWRKGANMPYPAEGAIAALVGDKMYVGGGCEMPAQGHDEWYMYDPVADSWTEKTSMPQVRGNGATFTHGGKVYVAAGFGHDEAEQRARPQYEVWAYDPATDSWDTSLADIPQPVLMASSGFHDGKMFLFGGKTSASPTFTRLVQAYDVETDTWSTSYALAPGPASGYSAGAFVDTTFYMFGGWDGANEYNVLNTFTVKERPEE